MDPDPCIRRQKLMPFFGTLSPKKVSYMETGYLIIKSKLEFVQGILSRHNEILTGYTDPQILSIFKKQYNINISSTSINRKSIMEGGSI